MDLLSTARHIVLIRRNGLGDLLCAMPIVTYCRQQAPEAKISLIVDRRNAPLVPYLQGIDKAVVWPKGNKYLGAVRVAIRHWWPQVDIAIAAKPTPTRLMSFALWATRAKHRFGVVDEAPHCRLINRPTPLSALPEGQIHQSLAILRLIAPDLNAVPEELFPKLRCPAINTMKPKVAFGQLDTPLVFVSMTSSRPGNALGVEGHSKILNTLAQNNLFRVAVCCEPRDSAKAHELVHKLKVPARVIATNTIGELIELLSLVDAVLVGDGGTMHIAAALDKPIVALFCRNRITQWGPLSNKAHTFFHDEHVCNIPVDTVVKAMIASLSVTT